MPLQLPFELKYDLTRRQRLIPHWKVWRRYALLPIAVLCGAAAALVYRSWWFPVLLLLLLVGFRGFLAGLLNVALVRRHKMDLVIEQNVLGVLAGRQRWFIPLDGLTAFGKLTEGVWTVQHWNGAVINIPVALLSAEQADFFRDWVNKANAIRDELGITNP